MIYIILEGHSYRHDIFELVRVFFPYKEITFTSGKEKMGDEGLLIKSKLISNAEEIIIKTSLSRGQKLIKEKLEKAIMNKNDNQYLNSPIKQAIKREIFHILVDFKGENLDWGILTGIRPVKIVHDLHEKNISDSKIYDILIEKYKLNGDRASLLIEIASLQRKYIYPLDEEKYSLYISIPFCPSKCSYCSFPSLRLANDRDIVKKYLEKLIVELRGVSLIMGNKKLNTVYIGGGTPTAIKSSELELIIGSVRKFFDQEIKEFTVEAGRPDTMNYDVLSMMKNYAVDRISINPQTMNKKTLKAIGRNHDEKSIFQAYNLAKKIGFGIINMDLILGLANENIEDLKYTLDRIKILQPDNLTIHTLFIKRGSKLSKKEIKFSKADQELARQMFHITRDFTKENKLIPYYLYRQKQILSNLENIGYTKKGKESIYNISMMEEKETVMGVGLGAVSKIFFPKANRIERVANFKDMREYLYRIDELVSKKKIYINK